MYITGKVIDERIKGYTGIFHAVGFDADDPEALDYFGEACGILHYKNGKLHNEHGPAIYGPEPFFTQSWFLNNMRHRIDGPQSYSTSDYFKKLIQPSYWLFNEEYSEREYWLHPLVIAHKVSTIELF